MKIRVWVGVVVVVLLAIFALQNTEVVPIRFLVWEWQLSRALLTFVQLAVGFVIGWMLGGLVRVKPR